MEPAFDQSQIHKMKPTSDGYDPEYAESLMTLTDHLLKDNGWQTIVAKDANSATSLESKQFPHCALPHYRLSVTIKLPRAKLVDKIWGVSTLAEAMVDNPNITEFDLLESNELYKVRGQVDYLGAIIWPRKTVFLQHKREQDDITWLVGYSVNNNAAPRKTNLHVRTNVMQSVYKFTSLDENTTLLQRVANVNPEGWLPTAAIISKAKVSVEQFNRWDKLYNIKE